VVQVPAKRNGPRGQWVEKYDMKPAEEYGQVVRQLGPGNVPVDPEATRASLEQDLRFFDPEEDYVLLLGDPVACAQVVHILAYVFNLGHFNALKWDGREERYFPYQIG
jgi:hypothetical protein